MAVTKKTLMTDMVVIVPGILGSVLQKDGKDLWAISGQAIGQVLKSMGDSVQDLKLEEDDRIRLAQTKFLVT